ncbi:MAG TPA: hypothetical protein P5163_18705 [Rubrivivax sp.]|nr:hypothetical protein [Rubrivivax sp.]
MVSSLSSEPQATTIIAPSRLATAVNANQDFVIVERSRYAAGIVLLGRVT